MPRVGVECRRREELSAEGGLEGRREEFIVEGGGGGGGGA